MANVLNGKNEFGLKNQNATAAISNEKERRSKPTALIILVWLKLIIREAALLFEVNINPHVRTMTPYIGASV